MRAQNLMTTNYGDVIEFVDRDKKSDYKVVSKRT